MERSITRRAALTSALILAAPILAPRRVLAAADGPLTVFAAASLQNALQALEPEWTRRGGAPLRFSFAGSSALARQIVQGAPADVFVSADVQWMDAVEKAGLVQIGTRIDLLTNRLALIAPATSPVRLKIQPGFPLAAALGDGRLALAESSVPAGIYAKAALTTLKVWDAVEAKIARAENVRGALNFVARGEAPLGIVYDTDARIEPMVRIVDLFPDDTHPPIIYPAALVKGAGPGAPAFFQFLKSAEAGAVFARFGFRRLPG